MSSKEEDNRRAFCREFVKRVEHYLVPGVLQDCGFFQVDSYVINTETYTTNGYDVSFTNLPEEGNNDLVYYPDIEGLTDWVWEFICLARQKNVTVSISWNNKKSSFNLETIDQSQEIQEIIKGELYFVFT